MDNLAYLLALHSIDGLGPIRLKRVLDHFKDPKAVWLASLNDLRNLGLPRSVIENLSKAKATLDVEKYVEDVLKGGIKVLTIFDENYPGLLKQIYDPPVVLYYKGEILAKDDHAIGVVGTRKITAYGKTVTEKFCKELVEAGFTIVSGLARGVDTVAHQTALSCSGRTFAVLGGGLNNIFPAENSNLADKIIGGQGAVISEFSPDYPALPGNFPARNRIIAGLSKAVLVTEATEDSGSLITANLSLEYGRDVFAVPGPITSSLSKGPANLIKQGASLAFEVSDILQALGVENSPRAPKVEPTNLSETERTILKCLETENEHSAFNGSKHIDEICRELNIRASEVSAGLIKMEILGLVKGLGGGNYLKRY